MKYLYTGDLSPGGWDEARQRILERTGRAVRSVGSREYVYAFGMRAGNLQCKLGTGPGIGVCIGKAAAAPIPLGAMPGIGTGIALGPV